MSVSLSITTVVCVDFLFFLMCSIVLNQITE